MLGQKYNNSLIATPHTDFTPATPIALLHSDCSDPLWSLRYLWHLRSLRSTQIPLTPPITPIHSDHSDTSDTSDHSDTSDTTSSEENRKTSEESNDTSEELNDTSEESNDTSEEFAHFFRGYFSNSSGENHTSQQPLTLKLAQEAATKGVKR